MRRFAARGYSKDTLARAQQRRGEVTAAERRLWSRLSGKQVGGYKFRRQVPMGTYVVGFVCYERKVIVELGDGPQAESGDESRAGVREACLRKWGYQVLRFRDSDVFGNVDWVVGEIRGAVESGGEEGLEV